MAFFYYLMRINIVSQANIIAIAWAFGLEKDNRPPL
jgi:hypothetical protein